MNSIDLLAFAGAIVLIAALVRAKSRPGDNALSVAKRAFDTAYERMMRELRHFNSFWAEVWMADYKSQPLKLENKD